METFIKGATVICSIEVYKAGVLYSPATSTSIKFERTQPQYCMEQDYTAMTPDSTGLFHYDFDTTDVGGLGCRIRVTYKLVDGARTSISKDTFGLEA